MTLDDVYTEVLQLVGAVGATIEVPAECEMFLSQFIEQFTGSRQELLEHIERNVAKWFRCLHVRPRWIQEAEWQFYEDKPMMFLGQIDLMKGGGLFHDDAGVFVFYSPETGVTKTVIQVA